MSLKEAVVHELDYFDEAELQKVADYVALLRHRSPFSRPVSQDDAVLAALYAEFAEEDRALAEEGMAEYADALAAEDAR